ncbi:MAG: glycosyltransferase family 2 protein [Bacteroidota bacterium]|nr:glycosyltransferase family 2 protein [Bacteroidota bacterium]MDP4250041.1 glycosyltransferase family 2 protein [Bacteroidota bacterium]
MYSPVISIITIVFNGEKYLEQTIRSVLDQNYPHIQYIIIDGGSTDESVNIIKKYEKHIHYWVSEKDKGISDAFNKGIARATGDVIGIINADDWFEPRAFERVAAQMDDADICFGDIQLWKNERKELIQKGNLQLLSREMTIHHATVFVKREIYETYGGFDPQYRCAMDYDLLLRFKVKNCRFSYAPYILSNMRWGGFSDKFWKLGCRETLEIKNRYLPENKFRNHLYYLKHLTAIRVAKTLFRLRLEFVTRIYRKLFSPIKKVYND